MKAIDVLKKIYCVFCLFVWAVGTIGGIGYSAYSHAWFVMVCVILLGAEAAPFMIARFKQLIG